MMFIVNGDDDEAFREERKRAKGVETEDEKVNRHESYYFDLDEIGDIHDDEASSEDDVVRTRNNLPAYDPNNRYTSWIIGKKFDNTF